MHKPHQLHDEGVFDRAPRCGDGYSGDLLICPGHQTFANHAKGNEILLGRSHMNIRRTVVLPTAVSSSKTFASFLLTLLLLAGMAFGQERFGELRGEATDSTGAVLPNIAVTARNLESGRAYNTTTSPEGTYIIRDVEPGRYVVVFELQGFSKYEVPNVLVTVGRQLRVDAKMTIGATEQTVQVTESAPLIDTSNVTVAHNITAEEFDRLPKARTFQSLVALSPSVNTGTLENGFQVNGASAAENQFNIDGISTNSIITGASRQDAIFEILQEVQVKTGGVDAEYGGAMGGVISAITKSGGNSFHGDIHYYYSGSKLSAGPVQRLLLDPINDKTVTYQQDHKNPSNNNEAGYSLGGYLMKNKLFFFSAGSPRFSHQENTYLADNGVNPIKISRDQTFWQAFNKVSFEPLSRVRGSVFWLWSPTKSTGTLPAYNYTGNALTTSSIALAPNPNIGYFAPQSNYGGQLDFTLSSTSLLTVRGGRFWDNYKDTGIPAISNVTYQTPTPNAPTATFGADLIGSIPSNQRGGTLFYNTPRYINNFYDLGTRTYVQGDYSLLGHFLGQHDLKIGGGIQKNVNKVDQSYPGGGYTFVYWDRSFRSSVTGLTQRGTYGYYEVDDFRTKGTTGAKLGNVYIQDRWRIGRLSLNLGVRFENEAIPSFQRNIRDNAFEFGWTDKIAPRLGHVRCVRKWQSQGLR